jgi:hypothetical protein
MATFTDTELRAISFNSMARASEAGGKAVMGLGLAVNTDKNNYILHTKPDPQNNIPGNNSGYTIGYTQWDFGQKENAIDLVKAYNASDYVKAEPTRAIPVADEQKYALMLQQNRKISPDGTRDNERRINFLRTDEKFKHIDAFLLTNDGYKFVSSVDKKQVDLLADSMKSATDKPAIQNMSKGDAAVVLAMVAKLKNQKGDSDFLTGNADKKIVGLLESTTITKAEIVEQTLEHYKSDKNVINSLNKTIAGAELYNTLSAQTSGPFKQIFDEMNRVDPTSISNFRENPNEQMVDAMFRHPAKAKEAIDKFNKGEDFIIRAESKIQDDSYTVGSKDGTLFTIDKDGKGYMLEQGKTEWTAFDNTETNLIYKDRNGRWSTQMPTLKVGDINDYVKDLQSKLNTLIDEGHLKGDKLTESGKFDKDTEALVKQLQQNANLSDDGIVGKDTRAALERAPIISWKLQESFKEALGQNSVTTDFKQCFRNLQNTCKLSDEDTIKSICDVEALKDECNARLEQQNERLAQASNSEDSVYMQER